MYGDGVFTACVLPYRTVGMSRCLGRLPQLDWRGSAKAIMTFYYSINGQSINVLRSIVHTLCNIAITTPYNVLHCLSPFGKVGRVAGSSIVVLIRPKPVMARL